jgi:hypothetical protein
VGFQSIDRWGNRLSLRLDPERSGTPPRYRLNGQSSLELDLPAYASLRELELRIGWYETCDSRLGANPLARPVGRLQKVVCLRSLNRPESAGPGAGPPAGTDAVEPPRLWEEFLAGFLLDLGRRDETWRSKALPFVREFGLRQALPFLGQEFRRSARADVAQILVELGGAEVLRAELAGADTLHRVQAAQALTNACDSTGFREFLTLLRARPKDLNLYGALMSLDTFLAACEPGAEERKEALELIVSNLHEQLFQARGFSILGRESGTDFGYSNATRLPVAQGRKEAVARAVEAARTWWNARRAAR